MADRTEKKYRESITGFFRNEAKNGGVFYNSLTITDEMLSRLGEIKPGGRLKIRFLEEPTAKGIEAFLDYVSPEEIEAYKSKRDAGAEKASRF